MAVIENKKDPKIVRAENLDIETPVTRRKTVKLLPEINQTSTIDKFFGTTFDHLFEPKKVKKFSGYVGQRPIYWEPDSEFYLQERSKSREFYQLEATMVSRDPDKNITQTLFYEDLLNHLRFQGGITNSHTRLFDQEYYSWSPPIDLDKLTAYTNYFWLEDGPNPIEITEPTDADNDIKGKTEFTFPISDLTLTSGLRIVLKDDANPANNNKVFGVEAVGRGIIFIDEDALLTDIAWDTDPRDTLPWVKNVGEASTLPLNIPDYIIMERGASDQNFWSTGNKWYHRDVIELSNTALIADLGEFQAQKPIIEFERNLKLFNFGDNIDAIVDVVYTETDDFFGTLGDKFIWTPLVEPIVVGWDLFGWDEHPWEEAVIFDRIGLLYGQYGMAGELINGEPTALTIDGIIVRDGMRILVTNDKDLSVNHKIYEIQGIKNVGRIILVPITTVPATIGDQYRVRYGNTFENSFIIFDGTEWAKAQEKLDINQPPLFQLYDIDKIALDDIGVYRKTTFEGSKLFGYKENSAELQPVDEFVGIKLSFNEFGDIIYENFLVTESYKFDDFPGLPIDGFYFYRRKGETEATDLYANNWYQITEFSKQYIINEFIVEEGQTEFELTTFPDPPVAGESPSLIVNNVESAARLAVDVVFSIVDNILTIPNAKTGEFYIVKIFQRDFIPDDDETIHYEIPLNLQGNPDNLDVTEISNSEWFDHFRSLIENQDNFEGQVYGINNWRDTPQERSFGRKILQHRAPLLKTMLLASDDNLDFMLAVRFVEREYHRFKNKFIQKINLFNNDLSFLFKTEAEWYDEAVEIINTGKTSASPFFNSNVANVHSFIPPTPSYLGVYRVYTPEFYLDDTFFESTWVIRGHDGSEFQMFGEHDGTDFTDKRDAAVFEFEQRIFDSIPANYKGEVIIDFQLPREITGDIFPGKYRKTDYTREEALRITRPMFERWASSKNASYRDNDTYVSSDKFTWNYGTAIDFDGESVPGNWRGMYYWFFDTDRPHTHPWELLGFGEKPDWWETRYGPSPYTGGNDLMWIDLEAGFIAEGPRQGNDPNYARPGLRSIIPVDPTGQLLDPFTARIVLQAVTEPRATADWKYGDRGPLENVWAKSEFYPFAIAQAQYLMKPARFIELGWDPNRWDYIFPDTDSIQWINLRTKDRPQHSQIIVHGELDEDGNVFIGSGIDQWISDWVVSNAQDITTTYGDAVRGLGVQLGSKVGGFLHGSNLKAEADNFGLVPQEDVVVTSYLSPSIAEHHNSGVIIEWTGKGFAVYGYDVLVPCFNTLLGSPTGKLVKISVGEIEPTITRLWNTNTAYGIGIAVVYNAIVYEANVDHTSTENFERDKWDFIGAQTSDQGIHVFEEIFPDINEGARDIPYGTVFKNQQDVYTFLINYERFLESEGWVFDQFIATEDAISNWRFAGKQFLAWSIDSILEPGQFIALSPAGQQIKFRAEHGAIQSVEQITNGVYSLLDSTGARILPRDTDVSRLEAEMIILSNQNIRAIYSARLFLKEFEHIILFSNLTIFNDLIYDPLFNVRQPRLKMIGVKTRNWTGRLDAPGYMVQEDTIYANFDKTAEDISDYYGIEESVDIPLLREHARHVVGYQVRDYLRNILPDPDVAFQFYQGMIQQKGTPTSIDKLIRVKGVAGTSELTVFEEWAFRLGRYGAEAIRPSIEFQLDRKEIRNNPQLIQFGTGVDIDSDGEPDVDLEFDDIIHILEQDPRWLRKPLDQENIWPLRDALGDQKLDHQSPGYIKIDEINFTALTEDELQDIYNQAKEDNIPFQIGNVIWVYDDGVGEFIAYKIFDFGQRIKTITEGFPAILTLNNDSWDDVLWDTAPWDVTIEPEGFIVIPVETGSQPEIEGVRQILNVFTVITGTIDNPVVSSGDIISIDGVSIVLSGGELDTTVTDINEANISGISALNIDDFISIRKSKNVIVSTINSPKINTGETIFINRIEILFPDGITEVLGTVENPTVVTSDSFSINDINITFISNQNLAGIISRINTQLIIAGENNISASNVDDKLKLTGINATPIEFENVNGFVSLKLGIPEDLYTPLSDINEIVDAINDASISDIKAVITISSSNDEFIQIISSSAMEFIEGSGISLSLLGIAEGIVDKNNVILDISGSALSDLGIEPGRYAGPRVIELNAQVDTDEDFTDDENQPIVWSLENVRFSDNIARNGSGLPWVDGDIVWVDDGRDETEKPVGRFKTELKPDYFTERVYDKYVAGIFFKADTIIEVNDIVYKVVRSYTTTSDFEFDKSTNLFLDNAWDETAWDFTPWDAGTTLSTFVIKEKYWVTYQYNSAEFIELRREELRLDNRRITNGVIYDKRTNKVVQFIDIYDPRKGIIPGVAAKEIWYKLEYDPAVYTNGDEEIHNIIPGKAWGTTEVGRVWWDINSAKYLDYEMADDEYRLAQWGRLAPGTSVDVYEWVRSTVPPAEWADNVPDPIVEGRTLNDRYSGQAKDADIENPGWVEHNEINKKTGDFQTFFYFWVKNVETVPDVDFRKLSAIKVADIITNPTKSGLLWFSPINVASLIVSNVFPFLIDDDTVLQINWKLGRLDVNQHAQWELMREGDDGSVPDDLLWNKMRDSLIGLDNTGLEVPDQQLSEVERLGTFYRPRQTWFKEKRKSKEIFIEKINVILQEVAIVLTRIDWDKRMFDSEAEPDASTYDFRVDNFTERDQLITDLLIDQDQKVFVEPIPETNGRWTVWQFINKPGSLWLQTDFQSFKVTDYWDFVDWYAEGFSAETVPDFTYADPDARQDAIDDGQIFQNGDVIKLLDNGEGIFTLETYDATAAEAGDDPFILVGAENSTIRISDIFWTSILIPSSENFNLTWDVDPWDTVDWDGAGTNFPYPFQEFRTIITALREDILIDIEVNNIFFTMVNYVHSEQSMIDWVFKTSYIFIEGFEENLGQPILLRADKTEDVINYIEETKPYHTKIRDLVQIKLPPLDLLEVHATDFDKPVYFDEDLDEFRVLDPDADVDILSTDLPWLDWYNDFTSGYNNVRKNIITLHYDRIKCWSNLPREGENTDSITILSNSVDSISVQKAFTLFTVTNSIANIQEVTIRIAPIATVIYISDGQSIHFETPKPILQLETLTVKRNGNTIFANRNNTSSLREDLITINKSGTGIIFDIVPELDDSIEITINENFLDLADVYANSSIAIGDDNFFNDILDVTPLPQSTLLEEALLTIPLDKIINPVPNTNISVTFNRGTASKGVVRIQVKYSLFIKLKEFNVDEFDAADRIAVLYNPQDRTDLPQKFIELINDPERIKGTTLFSSDLVDDGFFRHRYLVGPMTGCEFRGTIVEGQGGADVDNADLILKGGPDDFLIAGFKGLGFGTWDTSAWDEEPWDAAPNNEYVLPFIPDTPSTVKVTVNGIEVTLGTEYTIPTPPSNTIVFDLAFNPLFNDDIQAFSGDTFVDPDIDSSDIIVEGNEFIQPNWEEERPPELVKTRVLTSANISVFYPGESGCPVIVSDRFYSNGTTKKFELFLTPQSNQGLFVYANGSFLEYGVDYTIDWTNPHIIFEIGGVSTLPPSGTEIKVTSLGFGGHIILEQQLREGQPLPYELKKPTIAQNVVVMIDGVLTTDYDVTGNLIIFNSGFEPLTTQTVLYVVFEPTLLERIVENDPSTDTFILESQPPSDIQIQVLVDDQPEAFTYNPGTGELVIDSGIPTARLIITVYSPSEPSLIETERFVATETGPELFVVARPPMRTEPEHTAVFVYQNGLRLAEEETFYLTVKESRRIYFMRKSFPDSPNAMTLWSQFNPFPEQVYGTDYVVPTVLRGSMFSQDITIDENLANLGLTIGDLNPGDFFVVFGPLSGEPEPSPFTGGPFNDSIWDEFAWDAEPFDGEISLNFPLPEYDVKAYSVEERDLITTKTKIDTADDVTIIPKYPAGTKILLGSLPVLAPVDETDLESRDVIKFTKWNITEILETRRWILLDQGASGEALPEFDVQVSDIEGRSNALLTTLQLGTRVLVQFDDTNNDGNWTLWIVGRELQAVDEQEYLVTDLRAQAFADDWNDTYEGLPNETRFAPWHAANRIGAIVWSGEWWSRIFHEPAIEIGLTEQDWDVDAWDWQFGWDNGEDYTVTNIDDIERELHFHDAFTGDESYIVYTIDSPCEFELDVDQLTVAEVVPDDDIAITTLTYDDTYHIHTQKFEQRLDGRYRLSQIPFDSDYVWVHVNGERELYMKDYLLENSEDGWDSNSWDVQKDLTIYEEDCRRPDNSGRWDINDPIMYVQLTPFTVSEEIHKNINPQELNPKIKTIGAWDLFAWDDTTVGWESDRLPDAFPPGTEPGLSDVDQEAFDELVDKDTIIITTVAGPPVKENFAYRMFQDAFGDWLLERISDEYKTFLRAPYNDGDTVIKVNTNPNVSEDSIPDDILPTPTTTTPGIIWIEGERIEYWILDSFVDGTTGRTWYQLDGLITQIQGTSSRRHLLEDDDTLANNITAGYPAGTTVITSGPDQFITSLYPTAKPDITIPGAKEAIKLCTTEKEYDGDGVETEFDLIVTPSRITITTIYLSDEEGAFIPIINRTTPIYSLTDDKVIFNVPPLDGQKIKIVQILPNEFSLSRVSPNIVKFLRSSPGSYKC